LNLAQLDMQSCGVLLFPQALCNINDKECVMDAEEDKAKRDACERLLKVME
jgi:hypothetical protein